MRAAVSRGGPSDACWACLRMASWSRRTTVSSPAGKRPYTRWGPCRERRRRLPSRGAARPPACPARCAAGRGPGCSQAWVDRFAFEGQDTEDALVDPVERFADDEPLEGFDAEGELAQSQGAFVA